MTNEKLNSVLLLENVRSMHNVGSLFRTADAMGVSKIVLAGYTPSPIDRFGRVVKEIQKTSLGAVDTVPWEHVLHAADAIRAYKQDGYQIVVLEQDARSVSLASVHMRAPYVLVVGNEVDGVSREVRDVADIIVEIPMHGSKESLNVSVAGGIALWQLSRD